MTNLSDGTTFNDLESVEWLWPECDLSLKRTVLEIFDFKNVVILKSGSKVTQGHRNWHVLICHLWLPI